MVEQIPILLQYFVPGFIFLFTFQFFTSQCNKSIASNLLYDVVISYLLKSIIDLSFLRDNIIALCLFALITSVISIKVSEGKLLHKIFFKINHKTVFENIWINVIDYDAGTTLKFIYPDGSYVVGVVETHEEKGNESWFILDNYIVCEPNEDYNSFDYDYSSKIAVNLRDVKRVEIFNTK